ncbi:hypothetical protein L1887_15706 [Cichorium endivia]|nr:hypothetical protein L1887_15706 [Cichorium endivia]
MKSRYSTTSSATQTRLSTYSTTLLIPILPMILKAYAAILEHAYDKILTEKNNMEVALQERLAKHPDCSRGILCAL